MKKIVSLLLSIFALAGLSSCKNIDVDSDMMSLIESAAQNCTVDTRYAYVESCKTGEDEKIVKMIEAKKVTPLLGTFTTALGNKDDKIKAVACKYLYRHYRDNIKELSDNRDKISNDVVEAFLKNVGETKEYVSFYVAELATHFAMMKGMEAQLYKMLDAHPQEYTRLEGYRHLMRFGKMKVFAKVKELAQSADSKVVMAAFANPGYMGGMSDADKEQICPWAQPFLSHSDDNYAFEAAKIMNYCAGKYIDAMLDEAEKRAKENRLKSPFSAALTSSTFSCESFLGNPPTGTPEQCKRKDALVKKIAK